MFAAAWSPEGRAAALVRLADLGKCELLTSPHALAEADRNLKLKRSRAARRLETEVAPVVTVVAEATSEAVRVGLERGLPLKDAPILGAALRAGADMLVTGDARHFGHLYGDTIAGTRVVSPAVALAGMLELL
ncbi:MAG: PIN domain-containing protein [Actinomycetota bacterium]|nr:PIN domain-containing protein [Actinomycetota bacterium]